MQFKAKATRNVLYEQEDVEGGDKEAHHDRSQAGKKAGNGKTRDKNSNHASRSSKSDSGKKSKPWGRRKKGKHRDASSDEEEAVQGPQLTNIMQIMEQQQR